MAEVKKLEWLNTDEFFLKNKYFRGFQKLVPDFIDKDIYNPEIKKRNVALVCCAPNGPLTFNSTYSYGFDVMKQFGGDHRLTEYIYANIELTKLDLFFSSGSSCKAIRERFKKVKELLEIELAKKIKQTSNGKQLKILNIGSGPGKDVMDVVSRFISKNSSLKIKATMVDNDPFAIEKGKKYAHDLGLKKNIEFVEGSLKKFSRDNYDICLVIGVLCPFRAPTCISILTELKERLKSGGTMIASNISKKVCETEEGQFTRFIMEYICDWYLAFKNKNELKKIFESSGYANVMIDAEAIGYHLLGKGIN